MPPSIQIFTLYLLVLNIIPAQHRDWPLWWEEIIAEKPEALMCPKIRQLNVFNLRLGLHSSFLHTKK